MSGLLIKYNDIAIGAKESFAPTANQKSDYCQIELLQKNGVSFPRYDFQLELNSFVLDGKANFLPNEPSKTQIAYKSKSLSDENGNFETPIELVFASDKEGETFASSGLTLGFDTQKNVYATHINISWYRDGEQIDTQDFYPDSSIYYCQKYVSFYDKIRILLYSVNLPYSSLRLNTIDYGRVVEFKGKNVRSAKMIQEIDPISTEIPINTLDVKLELDEGQDYAFQERQALEVYFNEELRGTQFVKNAKRKAQRLWDIDCEDYIGLLDTVYFSGGIYNNKNAVELITEIFETAKVPFSIDESLSSKQVSGYIGYTSCRNALMQVCFATLAVADTTARNNVAVFRLSNEISQTLPRERIMQGQKASESTRVTAVELTAHTYRPISETISVYDANESGIGENLFVSFSEPLHDLTITNGEIVSRETNFAIINAYSGCVLSGKKYEHTEIIKVKKNPMVLFGDVDNIVAVKNATLVSSNNVDEILESCYNYIVKTKEVNAKIIESKHIINEQIVFDQPTKVSDNVVIPMEFEEDFAARIIKQSFTMNGGILVKDTTLR